MGRPARFTEERILDAALEVIADGGPAAATMAAIAARLRAPVGSLYHRFSSRDLLLARLWIRGIRRFQTGFLAALDSGDLVGAAVHTPSWCRANLTEARVLLLHRPEDLAARWPDELGEEAAGLNTAVVEAVQALAADRADLDRLVFALIDAPYGAVRSHLSRGNPPPEAVDGLIAETCRALLGPRAR